MGCRVRAGTSEACSSDSRLPGALCPLETNQCSQPSPPSTVPTLHPPPTSGTRELLVVASTQANADLGWFWSRPLDGEVAR